MYFEEVDDFYQALVNSKHFSEDFKIYQYLEFNKKEKTINIPSINSNNKKGNIIDENQVKQIKNNFSIFNGKLLKLMLKILITKEKIR